MGVTLAILSILFIRQVQTQQSEALHTLTLFFILSFLISESFKYSSGLLTLIFYLIFQKKYTPKPTQAHLIFKQSLGAIFQSAQTLGAIIFGFYFTQRIKDSQEFFTKQDLVITIGYVGIDIFLYFIQRKFLKFDFIIDTQSQLILSLSLFLMQSSQQSSLLIILAIGGCLTNVTEKRNQEMI